MPRVCPPPELLRAARRELLSRTCGARASCPHPSYFEPRRLPSGHSPDDRRRGCVCPPPGTGGSESAPYHALFGVESLTLSRLSTTIPCRQLSGRRCERQLSLLPQYTNMTLRQAVRLFGTIRRVYQTTYTLPPSLNVSNDSEDEEVSAHPMVLGLDTHIGLGYTVPIQNCSLRRVARHDHRPRCCGVARLCARPVV